MKRYKKLIIVLSIFFIFIIGNEAFAAKTLHDDFSIGTLIDTEKWVYPELVREVTGGRLIFKLGNNPFTDRDGFTAKVRHANPSMIETIQCEVTLNNIVSL